MQDDPEQSRAFIEKAREIEADEERSARLTVPFIRPPSSM